MIINDLDGYYIVFDTKNWNTELDTLPIKILKMLLTLQGIGYLKTQEEEYWYYYTTIKR